MIKIELNNQNLDSVCFQVALRGSQVNRQLSSHLMLMYYYGLRVSETLLTTGFTKSENGDLLIAMPKTGFTRIIKSDAFISQLDTEVHKRINNLSYVNKKALERLVKLCTPYANLKSGNKGINTHIFRHNFAKKSYAYLQNYEEVNKLLQEKTLSICKDYCTSVIYYYTV